MIVFSATPSSVTEPPVRLTQDAAKALRVLSGVGLKTGPGRTAENGGLLTATGEDDVISGVEIGPWEHRYCSSYRLSTADLVRLHQTLDHIAAAPGIKVVGYFRTCNGEQFNCSLDDIALVEEHLPGCRLMLMVKPSKDGRADMLALRLKKGGVWRPVTEFELCRGNGPQGLAEKPLRFAQYLVAPLPRALAKTFVPRRPMWSGKWIAAAVLGIVLFVVAAAVAWRQANSRLAEKRESLGLHVEMVGPRLHVMWSPSVGAKEGILRIDDGALHRDLVLDGELVGTGSILYQPSSDDVLLQLEVRKEAGPVISESLRVLDAPQLAAPAAGNTERQQRPVSW